MHYPKINEKKLVNQSDISGLIDNSDLQEMIATLVAKAGLIAEQDKIMKRQAFVVKVILKMMAWKLL